MAFALVIFEEENQLAAVPSTWIKGNFSAWPPCRNRDLKKLILSGAVPGTDWAWHKIKILSIYDTYEAARQHERKAEDVNTSNIDTDPEHLGLGYRHKRKFLSDSSSEDELPTKLSFPQVPEVDVLEAGREPDEEYVVLAQHMPEINCTYKGNDFGSNGNSQRPMSCQPHTPMTGSQPQPPSSQPHTPMTGSQPQPPSSQSQTPMTGSQPQTPSSQPQNRMARDILHMKLTLKDHGDMLQSILHVLSNFMDNKVTQVNTQGGESSMLPLTLPVQSFEELNVLEDSLQNRDVEEHLCAVMAQIGGLNPGNCIRRMMSKLMVNEVAVLFSWMGAKEKRPFVNLRVRKVIFDAARRNSLFMEVQDSTIEAAIKDWLRHAKARCKSKNAM